MLELSRDRWLPGESCVRHYSQVEGLGGLELLTEEVLSLGSTTRICIQREVLVSNPDISFKHVLTKFSQ